MSSPDFLSFHLDDAFVASYAGRPVEWGFPCGGGLSLGELTFLTKYSRLKADGTKERWHEACQRVVDGTYSLLKDHCLRRRTPWNERKAQRSAQEAYDRMWAFKWGPPGRGMAMMGTEFVHVRKSSAALQNCSYVSTAKPRGLVGAMTRLMEMSMLGVGVGFDSRAAADDLAIYEPTGEPVLYVVPDTREGWCESTGLLLMSYLEPGLSPVEFDYTLVRPEGAPINGYGGVAAGPEPLRELHQALRRVFQGRAGQTVTSVDVGDVGNLVGRCVVAGGVRRTAEIWLGEADDKAFLQAKDPAVYPERMARLTGWGWASNNSVLATVGEDYSNLAESIRLNGEPGLVYLDLCRSYGRLVDPPNEKDYRVAGINPCGEQPLEDGEMCTLVDVFPTRCDDLNDFKRTLKFAYLYGKAVTLFGTHWEDTNEIMRRNHRIGTSLSGQAMFVEREGWVTLKRWQNEGYAEVRRWDTIYSEWLGVRESVKVTTVKPDGTKPLLVGCTPGVHWLPEPSGYVKNMRFAKHEAIVPVLAAAGYPIEDDVTDARRVVVSIPVRGPEVRSEREVSLWEKAELAASAQKYWSDNAVSVTLTFRPDEADQVGAVIHAFDGRLKTVSFLPLVEVGEDGPYPQMPVVAVPADELEARFAAIGPVNVRALYGVGAEDAEVEKFCTTDHCEVPQR